MKESFKNIVLNIILSIIVIFGGLFIFSIQGYCKNKVVVIDPGHGGEAMGGNIDDRIERDINLITAMAMKNRLEQYDGVDVYITRDNNEDKDISRKERMDIAKEHDADFLFSIHYNMSENHTLYGSEVWVASTGTNYQKGYAFATIEINALSELGLLNRGIKNKLDSDKTGEYYGILKYAEEYEIPAVIIEHCHLDEERDSAFWNEESYKKFGEIDADSVAKYFNLSSDSLGVDYSNYEKTIPDIPQSRLDIDSSDPDYCNITIEDINDDSASIIIESEDKDTYIQYYQISYDGGSSFGRLETWTDRDSKEETITVERNSADRDIVVRTYNQYDGFTASSVLTVPSNALQTEEGDMFFGDEEPEYIEEITDTITEPVVSTNDEDKSWYVFVITLVVLLVIFNIIFFAVVISTGKKERKVARKKAVNVRKDKDIMEEFDF